jgi:uncharacterized RDD family membrane protein YckC
MADAAPYIGNPFRRVAAGAVDLILCLLITLFGWGMTVSSSNSSSVVELALLNKAAFAVYAGYHALFYWLLHGQTPGLLLFGMRIVRASDAGEPQFVLAVLRAILRPLAVYLIGLAAVPAKPLFGPIVSIAAIPLLIELGMMFSLGTRQTLSDIVCRTLVVNLPPPQPHRAPAGPMYSATDSEFGTPPRRK